MEVNIQGDRVGIKGPKGELAFLIHPETEVMKEDNQVMVRSKKAAQEFKPFWGMMRSLLNNAIKGVSQGYQKQLEIQGVGYRAKVEGDELIIEIGFSLPVKLKKPAGIDFSVEKNIVTISGIDKQLVGEMAAKIRAFKPPEPYKGKGIRYLGEVVAQKAGKRAAETTAT